MHRTFFKSRIFARRYGPAALLAPPPTEFLKVTGIIQAKCAHGTKGDFNYVADAAAFHMATFTAADSRNVTTYRCNERYASFGCQHVHTTAMRRGYHPRLPLYIDIVATWHREMEINLKKILKCALGGIPMLMQDIMRDIWFK